MTVEGLDARGAQVALADGALDVYVKPRGNASWRFNAGPFRINVKGTAFHLAFAADRGCLTLRMKSGLVEVLAPHNRTIAVGKDESLELYAEPARAEAPPSLAQPAQPAALAPRGDAVVTSVGRNAPTVVRGSGPLESARHRMAMPTVEPASVAWSKLLAKGDFADVIADAERRGIDTTIAQASASDLSALADAARYTKRYDLARQVLLAKRSRFVGTDHARDASFFLGRLAEAAPDRSQSALDWYETYLREAPRGLYASEALGREMALLAPSAPERARKVAGQYLARFPHGPQSELARSLLETE
jgi:TolA-binding protein